MEMMIPMLLLAEVTHPHMAIITLTRITGEWVEASIMAVVVDIKIITSNLTNFSMVETNETIEADIKASTEVEEAGTSKTLTREEDSMKADTTREGVTDSLETALVETEVVLAETVEEEAAS